LGQRYENYERLLFLFCFFLREMIASVLEMTELEVNVLNDSVLDSRSFG